MKVLLFSALLALAAAPFVRAQAPATVKTKVKQAGPPSAKAKTTAAPTPSAAAPSEEMIDAKANALTANMQENLGLTPPQVEKVRAINRRGVEQVETARAQYRTDPRKLSGIIESAGRARLDFLKDVLTPAQFNKYQRKREEKMGIPSAQGARGNPVPGMNGRSED